jgi:hypothetical protein
MKHNDAIQNRMQVTYDTNLKSMLWQSTHKEEQKIKMIYQSCTYCKKSNRRHYKFLTK